MMTLGPFVFHLKTAAPDSMSEQINWRHASQNRLGASPAYQFVGTGAQTITLPGVLYPEITGDDKALAELREMADSGSAWPLADSAGESKGHYFITRIERKLTSFFADGRPRKIEFSLSLTRADESDIKQEAQKKAWLGENNTAD